jgi:hypothetical protein
VLFTEQPAATQLIGSSGRQSPPDVESMCARSPVPTNARSIWLFGCTVVEAME